MVRRRVRIRDNNRIPEIISQAGQLNGKKIRVGVFGPAADAKEDGSDITIGHLATIHEYGVTIQVTDKMRKYLAFQGLYLKKETTEIVIPERSFIRSGWDANENQVLNKASRLIRDAITAGVDLDVVLDAIGIEARDRIRTFARDLRNPENHPFTVSNKDSSNPLVDGGQLVESIRHEVFE